MKKILSTLFVSLMSLMLYSQVYDQKFGKVSMAEMEMKVCPIDSSAEAAILFDIGETRFEYNTTDYRFQLKITRHVRLKVLNKEGLDWANFNLLLYKDADAREKLDFFKGYTYNLESGKIVKEKVEKKSMFEENKDSYHINVKTTFPKVVEGSVIEYEYQVTSDYIYNLQPWSFQGSIPTLFSQYTASIPEYYRYNTYVSGYENIAVKEESRNQTIVFRGFERTSNGGFGGGAVSSNAYNNEVKYLEKTKIYTAQNVPALNKEAYVDNIDNYKSKVFFELASKEYPGEMRVNYTDTWAGVNSKLLDDTKFGRQLDNGSYMEELLLKYIAGIEKTEEKIAKIVEFVGKNIKWNDQYNLFPDKGTRLAFKNGVGNSAEINLNLVIAFRKAGFTAYPIVLSTRSHGLVNDWQKTIIGFNHVIAGIKFNETILLYDLTSPFPVNGLLPTQSLNGRGRIVDPQFGDWVDLNPKTNSRISTYAALNVDGNASITGVVESSLKDYFALDLKERLKDDDSLINHKKSLLQTIGNGEIDSLKVKFNQDGLPEVKQSFNLKTDAQSVDDGNIIYLSPMLGFGIEKNPFVKPERKFPVNYAFSRDESIMIKYKLPKGYIVDEIPSNAAFSMSDGKTKFSINYQVVGEELTIVSKLRIPMVIYNPIDYPALRGFIDEVIKKQNEKVVFKKTNNAI